MTDQSPARRGPRPRYPVKTTIQLSLVQAEYLERRSVERGVPVAQLIRQAVDRWIERDREAA